MQCAARARREAGAVEEDAGVVDDAGVPPRVVAEDAAIVGVRPMLEALGLEGGRERGDQHRLVLVAKLGADGATALPEVLRGLVEDAQATPAPDARPRRREKVPVESPDHLTVVDLLPARIVHRLPVYRPRRTE